MKATKEPTKNLDPNNENHWMTFDEFMKRAHAQNTITKLTKTGAPRPAESSPLWNEWASNNPTGAASALAKVNVKGDLTKLMTAISRGARPVEAN
jgi:hypothetical protein